MTAAPIRVADLGNPELTPMQQMALKAVGDQPLDLSVDAVLDAARTQTGLSDFGPDDFLERLGVWVRSYRQDSGLGPIGQRMVQGDMVRYAATRLRLQDLWTRHPEIDDEAITEPIIVVGLPRSGTTHLLNLIAADSRLRSLPYWESLAPVPDGDAPVDGHKDPRLVKCQQAYALQTQMAPLLKNMHDMAPEHVHEEIELQGPDFSSYLPEWLATVPQWRDYYYAHDQRPHYAYMKRVLKTLQWLRGPDRWILKSPQHLEQLGPLMDTFPDATVAITHRDPLSVIASASTMLSYGDRMRRTHVDPPAVAAYWADRVEHMLRACVRDRDLLPKERSIDVPFAEFMADDVAMVARIYEVAGLPMSAQASAELDAYMKANPRGKHGRLVYDLAGDFDVDVDALRDRFAFYYERFNVQVER